MADTFHRLVAPTYYTGGPTFPSESGVTYDYINNGGAGTPSFADGAKVGGPNAGTYFTGFGEDATSQNVNRPSRALADNCDHLDNLLHRSIASAVRTADVNPGAPVSTITLPVGTFLGIAGYTSSTADLNRLFEILDSSDEEIINQSTGATIRVTSVTLGAGDAIGGGGANGSFSGNTVQLNIAPSIPASQIYRVYYGTRANLATLPLDALTSIKIRGAEEVSGVVENLLRQLHGNNLSWNASWTSTIWDLAASGLADRYNRGTSASPGGAPEAYWSTTLDTEGAGGWILRTGPALTVYSGGDDTGLSDPLNGLFVAKNIDTIPEQSGGIVSYAALGSRRSSTANADESAPDRTPGAATFMGLWPHDFGPVSAADFYTRVEAGSTVTLSNVGSYNQDTGEAIVQLTAASNYFRSGGNSSVAIGYDLLDITYTIGGGVATYVFVIVGLGSSTDPTNVTKARVRFLNGTVPDFSGTSGATVNRWISNSFSVGDGAGRYHRFKHAYADNVSILFDGLFYQVPPSLSTQSADNNVFRVPARISAQTTTNSLNALEWGGFTYTVPSGPTFTGFLRGDGSIALGGSSMITGDFTASGGTSTSGAFSANYHLTTVQLLSGTLATAAMNCANGSSYRMVWTNGTGQAAITLNITNARVGSVLVLFIEHTGGAPVLTWGGAGLVHYHSSGDDQPLAGVTSQEKWVGHVITATQVLWTLTRY